MRHWLILFCLLVASMPIHAEVYTLYPDGSGDFSSIQEAIIGSVNGDIIELTNGSYTGLGNRDIDFMGRAIILRSVSDDPEICIIDIQGTVGNGINEHGLIFENGEGPETIVRGITVTNAALDGG
jgi:hypothetical protein